MGFVWNRGLLLRDMSVPAQGYLGYVNRPVCMYVGDEDLTSTGTDWIRRMSPSDTFSSGGRTTMSNFAWMSGDKRGHESGFVPKPYSNPMMPGTETYHEYDVALDLMREVAAALPSSSSPVPQRADSISQTFSSDRDSEDASEWVRARRYVPPPTGGALVEDTAFFDATQPGWAGTGLGKFEAILIDNGKVIVGSAEGIVSAFVVAVPGDSLVCVDRARPRDPNSPTSYLPEGTPLGHNAFGLAKLADGYVVGTRRHLVKLNNDLDEVGRINLSWQRARPNRIRIADVVADPGFPGPDIVLTSGHGPLLVYSSSNFNANAQPFEYKEPGVVDLVVPAISYNASTASHTPVSLFSHRGLIANITLDPGFGATHHAELQAASDRIDGDPRDLERLDVGGEGLVAISEEGADLVPTLSAYNATNLNRLWQRTNFAIGRKAGEVDLATAKYQGTVDELFGEHIVLLCRGYLYLFSNSGHCWLPRTSRPRSHFTKTSC
jgi:hypothetical protein